MVIAVSTVVGRQTSARIRVVIEYRIFPGYTRFSVDGFIGCTSIVNTSPDSAIGGI